MMIHWILVGLLSICSFSYSQDCIQRLEADANYPGTDIESVFSPDAQHCQLMCTQHPECLFFTFFRQDWTEDDRNFKCFFRKSDSGLPDRRTPLVGVTSGYSLKPCSRLRHTNERPCLSNVFPGVSFTTDDYRSLFTPDYQECQRACTHEPGCQFFTFNTEDFATDKEKYKCLLKFSYDVVMTPGLTETPDVVSGFTLSTHVFRPTNPDCKTTIFEETDFPNDDLTDEPASSAEHCLALCSSHPLCNHFSFDSTDFTCYLKSFVSGLPTLVDSDYSAGVPTRHCQRNSSWVRNLLDGIDFEGSDIRFEDNVEDAEACQRICTSDQNCQFFSYFTDAFSDADVRGRCMLKRVIVMPAPAGVAAEDNVVSGFSLRNCGAGSPQFPYSYRVMTFVSNCGRM